MLESNGSKRSAAEAGLSTANFRQQDGQSLHAIKGRQLSASDRTDDQQTTQKMNTEASDRELQDRKADDYAQGEWSIAESKSSRKKKRRKIANDFDAPPSISFLSTRPAQVQLKALQELALYILVDGIAPTWLAVNNARQIQKVVVLMIPGLDRKSLEKSSVFKPLATNGESRTCESAPTESEPLSRPEGETTGAGISLQQRDEFSSETSTPAPQNPACALLEHIIPVKAPGDSGRNQIHSPLQSMLISPYSEPKDKRGKDEKSQ
jgi:RNA exonuclease 1